MRVTFYASCCDLKAFQIKIWNQICRRCASWTLNHALLRIRIIFFLKYFFFVSCYLQKMFFFYGYSYLWSLMLLSLEIIVISLRPTWIIIPKINWIIHSYWLSISLKIHFFLFLTEICWLDIYKIDENIVGTVE